MKRIEFIKRFSLLGVGLSLTPWSVISAKNAVKNYQLPPPVTHIPHGNFSAQAPESLLIPELNLTCSVERFMKNGIEACDDDMTVYSFSRKSETLLISYSKNGYSAIGEINGVGTEVLPTSVHISSKTHQLLVSHKEVLVRKK